MQCGVRSMDYFFHADTTKYRRRLRGTAIIVLVPLFGVCVFCAVNILLNLSSGSSSGLIRLMGLVIAMCVLVGTSTMFVAAFLTKKYIARHSRFTYLDILPDGFVFSLYAGEFRSWNELVILRRLYYVPFSGVTEISRDPKTSPLSLTIKGDVRCYFGESDRLGYHVDEDGHTQFDSAELNERGYERSDKLEINGYLGPTKKIQTSLEHYLEEYRAIPEKKPFNIAEHITRRQKKRPTTSNSLLEAPSYSRNWK